METTRFTRDTLSQAAAQLKTGQLVAFPTETVYGLGANALDQEAVKQVFHVKGRPSDNPLIVHVTGLEQVMMYVDEIHPLTKTLVEAYWPGPLTIILPIKEDAFPSVVTGGLSTVAFRMPDHALTLDLIETAGVPIVGPSANLSGTPSPTTADHVLHDFTGKIAGVLDGGATKIGVESTVIDLSDPTGVPVILRPGAITGEMLSETTQLMITNEPVVLKGTETPKAPGMKYKHYSPKTNVIMVDSNDFEQVRSYLNEKALRAGILAGPTAAAIVRAEAGAIFMYQNDTVEAAAKGLFSGLRALDECQADLDVIFVETKEEHGLGYAYMNRLKKAANQQKFTNND